MGGGKILAMLGDEEVTGPKLLPLALCLDQLYCYVTVKTIRPQTA